MNDLLNGLGLATGLALYAMLLSMVARDRARGGRFDPVPLTTALLGIVWNVCSLSTYVLPRLGFEDVARAFSVVGVIALGLLPAVVVHSVARGPGGGRPQPDAPLHPATPLVNVALGLTAYGASAAAAVLQVHALWTGGPVPSVLGLQLLTYTFMVLAIPLVAVTSRQPGGRRALWIAALAAFAVSALHLGQVHEPGATWWTELLGHHASIPLVLAILYQDYPFALADLFLKRALLLIALVATALAGLSVGTLAAAGSSAQFALLAAGWVATALAYPWLRAGINWFVDTIVLARPHYRSFEASVLRDLQSDDTAEALLDRVQQRVAAALSATSAAWHELEDGAGPTASIVDTQDGATVRLTIPTSEPPAYVMQFQRLAGGRRVLSGDMSFLANVAIAAARRLDAQRLTQERYERAVREQEVEKLASQAELKALRAQLNPHFLFNALTTIGYLIQTAPPRALETLLRLTSLLRGVLRSEGEFTPLGRELDLVEAYLDIERARFEHRLRVRIDVAEELRDLQVPPLILQPLVENAVKHGISPLRHGGEITVTASYRHDLARLVLEVADTGPGLRLEESVSRRQAGVGLANVEQRLRSYYGTDASFTFDSSPGRGTRVGMSLPAPAPASVAVRRP